MKAKAVELKARYADWSDEARVGLAPPGGEAGLTAAVSEAGGLSLYLEREVQSALLHVEVSDAGARRLYEFLRARFDGPLPRRRGKKSAS